MEPLAVSAIKAWNQLLENDKKTETSASLGLIAVSFDQRNHGTRKVSALANEAWRSGNPTHAQDLFSIYNGALIDTSLLLDNLSSYVFPSSERSIVDNIVLGVSLGGHAVWQCLLHEPRITAGIVIIGCPDFVRLMRHRAAKSKLETWTSSEPPGASFLGSTDFPFGLLEAVRKWDPVGFLLKGHEQESTDGRFGPFTSEEIKGLRPFLRQRLGGKRILNLAGAADKLVPYSCSMPFMEFLQDVTSKGTSWLMDEELEVQNHVYDGVGHEMTREMVHEAVKFITARLERDRDGDQSGSRDSHQQSANL
ncbi:MAG: hypothetical protein M1816_001754 [Peltula sp. TS41687]|nr:MAG: hypothetical protein M1816_001754 [Peltula sp. TS41687]